MKILYYLIISFASYLMYTWIKKQRWIHKHRPGNDIPHTTYKQTFSQKKHSQIVHTSGQITTINLFLESYRLLDLSLFTREELSERMINDAYSKKLKEHINDIQKGIETDFDTSALESAREYLIQKLNHQVKFNTD